MPKEQLYYGHVEEVQGPDGEPIDPGYGQGHPLPPHVGGGPIMPGGPVDPGYGQGHPLPPFANTGPVLPTRPVDPGWGVGPVLPIPPIPPSVGGSGKPSGIPIAPMDPTHTPPTGPPTPPGTWVTLDAGKGQPPAWGYVPHDSGLGGGPPPVASPGPVPPQPPTVSPAASGQVKGHWVPLGKPPVATPQGGAPAPSEPTWAFVPEIGPDYGTKPVAGPKK
jgi:hypothetical protein